MGQPRKDRPAPARAVRAGGVALPAALAAALALSGLGVGPAAGASVRTAALAAPVESVALAAATPQETTKVVTPLKAKTYSLSSYYGPRCIPTVDASDWHFGQDLAAKDGSPIYAVADGVVRTAGPASGFGQWIVIDHVIGGKKVSTVYGHMWNGTKYVKSGQVVKAGQHIADVGANGIATGPHLHLEVWPGGYGTASTDPLPYLKAHKVDLAAGASSALKRTTPTSCTYYATTRLNLRTSASTSSVSKLVLPVNASLATKPGSKDDGWFPVTYGSTKGWVSGLYVSPSKVAVPKPPAPPKPAATPKTVRYVAVTTLNLRASASTSSKVVAKLSRGTAVTYQGTVSKTGWVKVTAAGKTGYVDTEYVRTTKILALYDVKYVDVTTLNLRSKATTSSSVVAKLKRNAAVQPQAAASRGWQKVTSGGKTGYVATEYLRATK